MQSAVWLGLGLFDKDWVREARMVQILMSSTWNKVVWLGLSLTDMGGVREAGIVLTFMSKVVL